MNPVDALREIGFLLERTRSDTHRVKAYRRAADIVADLDSDERARHVEADDWKKLPGIGPKTALVISQACAGRVPDYLQQLRDERQPLVMGGERLRALIKGDLHVHSTWSDGGSPLEEMMITARSLGYGYCAITDHSPRLTKNLELAKLAETAADEAERLLRNARHALRTAAKEAAEQARAGMTDAAGGQRPHRTAGGDP